MLLPAFSLGPCPAATIGLMRERDMPHGYFGDRDAGHDAGRRRIPAACGLFGRRGDDPLVPHGAGGPWRRPTDRPATPARLPLEEDA